MRQNTINKLEKANALISEGMSRQDALKKLKLSPTTYYNSQNATDTVKVYKSSKKYKKRVSASSRFVVVLCNSSQLADLVGTL